MRINNHLFCELSLNIHKEKSLPNNFFQRVFCEKIKDNYRRISFMLMILCMASFMTNPGFSDDKKTSDKKAHIEKLINKMASRNEEPTITSREVPPRDDEIIIPKNFDAKAQDDVFAARKELILLGDEAFPELFKHLDDRRYSYTCRASNGMYYGYDVGLECKHILASKICVYAKLCRPQEHGSKPAFFPPYGETDLKKWFKSQKNKELWEFQRDAAKWAIEEEKKYDAKHVDYDSATPTYDPKEELERTVFGLELMIKLLETTKKPLPVSTKLPQGAIDFSRSDLHHHIPTDD